MIHPSVYAIVYPEADYFALTKYSEEYTFDGQSAVLTYWHRPLHAITDAFAAAGFRIATVSEPPPASDTPPELLPPTWRAGRSCASSSSSLRRPSETELRPDQGVEWDHFALRRVAAHRL